jgi:hypothetical protein
VTSEAEKAKPEIMGYTTDIIGLRGLSISHLDFVATGLVLKAEI